MYAGVVLAITLVMRPSVRAQVLSILIGASWLVLVGILDDRGWIHHQLKLLVAMPVAAAILIAAGLHTTAAGPLFRLLGLPTGSPGLLTAVEYIITLFWVVGITAAFSILDHMDGLCAGIAAMASAFFLALAVVHGQTLVAILAAAVLGASLGFLGWNFHPARIFMGDAGAMFLGFMMAVLGLKLRFSDPPAATDWMIPVLILGVPIFDTTLVCISRARRRLIPFSSPGTDHTAHRLVSLGLDQARAVLLLYAMGGFCGLAALWVSTHSISRGYGLLGALIVASLLAIVALERTAFERHGERPLPFVNSSRQRLD